MARRPGEVFRKTSTTLRRAAAGELSVLRLVIGKSKESTANRTFTIRLFFLPKKDAATGANVFNVNVQDKIALKEFDVARERGGNEKMVIRELRGILAGRELSVASGRHVPNPDRAAFMPA